MSYSIDDMLRLGAENSQLRARVAELEAALERAADDLRFAWQFLDAVCLTDGSIDRRKARDAALAALDRAREVLKGGGR